MSKIKPKKSLGQNFLRDEKILKKIAGFVDIKKDDVVVEVGPGEGTLTKLLLEKAKKIIAVEKDKNLTEKLKEKFKKEKKEGKFEIICADILDSEQEILERTSAAKRGQVSGNISCERNQYKLVGNIPYYITGALFKKFLSAKNQPKSITFVVQKEVADRIMARDGKESVLSISVKAYGMPKWGGVIKAGSFFPRPKVDSAIIAIREIGRKRFEKTPQKSSDKTSPPGPLSLSRRGGEENAGSLGGEVKNESYPQKFEKKFFEILRAGFAHKRKLLIKNLSVSKEVFKKCGIPEKARAENLEVGDWICLTEELM